VDGPFLGWRDVGLFFGRLGRLCWIHPDVQAASFAWTNWGSFWGMQLAHLGLAIVVVGITG
jgi:hypothetical protein